MRTILLISLDYTQALAYANPIGEGSFAYLYCWVGFYYTQLLRDGYGFPGNALYEYPWKKSHFPIAIPSLPTRMVKQRWSISLER